MFKENEEFEDILRDFLVRIEERFGPKSRSSVHKIAVTHELYYSIVREANERRVGFNSINLHEIADFKLLGVKILPRHKDEF